MAVGRRASALVKNGLKNQHFIIACRIVYITSFHCCNSGNQENREIMSDFVLQYGSISVGEFREDIMYARFN